MRPVDIGLFTQGNFDESRGSTMLRRQADARADRVIWRTTVADPVPVDIDLTDLKPQTPAPLDVPDRGWLESSYDLRHGLDVRELPMDKLPDELFRAFARCMCQQLWSSKAEPASRPFHQALRNPRAP